MTSATDAHQHPDISEISDLTEGVLSPTRTADIRRHVAGCAACSDLHASLEEIRSLLGALPGPQRMPEDIGARIEAALTEAAETTVSVRGAAPTETTAVSRETAAATMEPPLTDRPSGRPRGATGPGRRPTSRRRRTAILGAAFGAAVVGMGAILLQSVQAPQDAASKVADRSFGSAEDSGAQNFSEGTLQKQVDTLLSSTAAEKPHGDASTEPSLDTKSSPNGVPPETSSSRTPLRTPVVSVPPCIQQGTGRETSALAVEEGQYQGMAAFLVVLPHATDPSRVQAYIVDAACVSATPATKGRLLLTHTYARH